MNVVVVSDTSPLRALQHLGETNLLPHFYRSVLVPPAVARELLSPRGMGAPVDVTSLPFVTVQAPTDAARVQYFRRQLDPGESEAIALAIEVQAEALLIDEFQGRAAATAAGLKIIGVLGILQRAKKEGLIDEVRSRMDRLRNDIQFFISDQLYDAVVRSAGEQTGT